MKKISYQALTNDGLYLYEPTHIRNCKFFKINGENHHSMELHGDGLGNIKYIVEECVFDNTGINPKNYDEGVALVNAPNVVFNRCRFKNLGKACLVGNGDHIQGDKNLKVTFNNCVFENCGRRGPFIQYGHAEINNCVIKNWGDPKYFYLKSFGLRVGKDATCKVFGTVFWQDKFWPGLKNFITDVVSQYDPIIIPGNFRAAYAETGGILELEHCFFNSKFLYTRSCRKNKNTMTKKEAYNLMSGLDIIVPKL